MNTDTNSFSEISTYNKWAVRSISQVSDDELIISFWNSGILRIDNKGNRVSNHYDELIENVVGDFRVLSFLKEDENSYWIGTRENGVFNFTLKNDSINLHHFNYKPNRSESIGSNSVSCMLKDRSNVIWLGQINAGGLTKVVSDRFQLGNKKETANLNVNSIFVRSPNKMWIGTQGNGLFYFDFQNNNKINLKKTSDVSLNIDHNIVQKIHEDHVGNLWIGTHGKGIKIISKKQVEEIERNILPDRLDYVNLNKNSIPNFNDYILDICSDLNGNIWIGTAQGLFFVNRKFISANIKQIPTFSNQDLVQNYFKNNPLFKKLEIFSLYIDELGNLWVSTRNKGLLKINPNGNQEDNLEVYSFNKNDSNSLQSNKVFNCRQDSYNRIWVTSSKGLDIIDLKDNSVKNILTDSDIGNSEVFNLTFDQQNKCWLALSYGLYRFDIENNEIRKYFRASTYGNFNNLNAISNSNDGTIFLGSRDGVTFFNPASISNTEVDIPFYITSFKINNVKVKPGQKVNGRVVLKNNINEIKGITLKNSDHHISFDIALLDYLDRTSIEYKYILEGAVNEWTALNKGQHTISFTNLRRGNYTLRVKATNSEGVWDGKEIGLIIEVLPVFWQSNIAIGIYSILLLVLLYLFYSYSILREKEKNKLRLIQVEKEKSEELNNLKLQFFTNISHEFRTPLSLILTPLEIIIGRIKDFDTLQQLNLIQRNANRLLFLINQIIDIRKLDAGKLKLSIEPVNLSSFSNEIFELFKPLAGKKQIDFTIQKTVDTIYVNFDRHYLESVLYNILSNAFRFTGERGSIQLNIFESEQHACVSVSDTGKGIPAEHIDKIFERFYHSTEKGKDWTGAGIGLSFSKSIIDMHNGDIEVESEEGKGSTFKIKIPLTTENITGKEEISESVQKNIVHGIDSVIFEEKNRDNNLLQSPTKNKEFSILVVEDNSDLRNLISEQLKIKYNIFEAENGKVGWELVQSKQPDLIITDLMMPEMNGLELCDLIKSSEEYSHIPVVILTAKNLEEDKVTGYKTGADAYIFKPFKFNFLCLRIENLLDLKSKVKSQLSSNLYVAPKNKLESKDKIFVDKTIALVEENISNSEFNVDDMYKSLGYSRTNLYRKIKELTGYSAKEFVREIRLQNAAQMFRANDINVNEVAYSTGFESTSYFSKCFKKRFNMSPVDYKNKFYKQTKIDLKT